MRFHRKIPKHCLEDVVAPSSQAFQGIKSWFDSENIRYQAACARRLLPKCGLPKQTRFGYSFTTLHTQCAYREIWLVEASHRMLGNSDLPKQTSCRHCQSARVYAVKVWPAPYLLVLFRVLWHRAPKILSICVLCSAVGAPSICEHLCCHSVSFDTRFPKMLASCAWLCSENVCE